MFGFLTNVWFPDKCDESQVWFPDKCDECPTNNDVINNGQTYCSNPARIIYFYLVVKMNK